MHPTDATANPPGRLIVALSLRIQQTAPPGIGQSLERSLDSLATEKRVISLLPPPSSADPEKRATTARRPP